MAVEHHRNTPDNDMPNSGPIQLVRNTLYQSHSMSIVPPLDHDPTIHQPLRQLAMGN